MSLKEKRCSKIKDRGCADGRIQRLITLNKDASSPIVSNESVFLTAAIDTFEKRHVAVVNVLGAFL